jgi:hypothetical protein
VLVQPLVRPYKTRRLLGANGLYLKTGKMPIKFSVDTTAWTKLPKEGSTAKIYSNGIMCWNTTMMLSELALE